MVLHFNDIKISRKRYLPTHSNTTLIKKTIVTYYMPRQSLKEKIVIGKLDFCTIFSLIWAHCVIFCYRYTTYIS